MRLRTQLLLVSLLTLALPWAGCQYVREMERAQRQGVEDGLLASATIVASALAARPELLYPYLEVRTATRDPGADIYATRVDDATVLDGYADNWVERIGLARAPGSDTPSLHVEYVASVDRHYLNLFVSVRDDNVVWLDPALGDIAPNDHVIVAFEAQDGYAQRYVFATAAPGALTPVDAATGAPASRLRGWWQAVPRGYQLEMRIPLALVGARFGFAVVDADASGYAGAAGTLRDPDGSALPGLLVYAPNELRLSLAAYRESGKRLRVLDRTAFELATVGALEPLEAPDDDTQTSDDVFLAPLYRMLLGRDDAPAIPATLSGATTDVAQSPSDTKPSTAWYGANGSRKAIVAATAPIRAGDELLGSVVLEQTSDAILTLTNRALARLVNATLFASLLAAAGLLGYATWLSLRIRRLRNAAERALDARGRIAADLPGVAANDEIGDLARGFTTLLERLREHTEYLQTLASKLSHELRTPLAVVQSSLENLAQHPLDDNAAVYAGRAQDGANRLRAILSAMSEATRVEQSIQGVQLEPFDLREVLLGAVAAYRDVYRERRIELTAPQEPCTLRGAPELIVQMLDKLVENAVDFTPPDGRIEIGLSTSRDACTLAVANDGPLLPATMQGSLFDSLVSVRTQRGDRPHLGLGLHIARLIAEAHGGTIEACDLPDARGVEFLVMLPRAH
jgi:two-component system sensor histidine kinase ChvG